MLGTTLSHYRILSALGRGGMGVVYEAEDLRLGRRVALKLIPPETMRDETARRRFEREARAASALNHPNICTVHDVGEHEGQPFLVMELLEGESLRDRLARGPLPPEEALAVALQIASALAAAAEKGIVHRDLKPANIFLTRHAGAKVLDFGLVKLDSDDPIAAPDEPTLSAPSGPATAPGTVLGTLAYMSPEQLRGEPLDARSDLFSFGTVLYEVVSGRHPFAAASAPLVSDAILHREPPPAKAASGTLPDNLTSVIARALEKDVRLRYQNARDMAADLLRAQRRSAPEPAALRPRIVQLPVALSSFVGRENELRAVGEALGRSRLVTLTGPGGSGKTRLAIRAAEEAAAECDDGAVFVALGAVGNPDLFLPTVAQAVGLREVPELSVADHLSGFLAERALLLVLDNFEHLLPAGEQLAKLLRDAPRLRVLVTSREVLRLTGEAEVAVQPLALPDGLDTGDLLIVGACESVALFCERAAVARPGFALSAANVREVAEICVRLDGLPLAIELAAARLRHLTPAALLQRLSRRLALLTGGARDLPARQQTLRDAIAWSHDLLSHDERALFARLSVFAGGFTLTAAEVVSAAVGPLDLDVFDGIASLVDKSLLRADDRGEEPRYSMLETIREFGAECLAARAEAAAASRAHAEHCRELARRTEAHLFSPAREAWLKTLDAEHANLRAALAWSASADGDPEIGLEIAGDLQFFWTLRGYLAEGPAAIAALLRRQGSRRSAARAKALVTAGVLGWLQGDYAIALEQAEEGVAIARELGDDVLLAWTHRFLAVISESNGLHRAAIEQLAASAAMMRRLGDRHGLAFVLVSAVEPDDLDAARRDYTEALEVCREVGDRWNEGRALRNLAILALRRGDLVGARAQFEECLALEREIGDRWQISRCLNHLGDIARCEARLEDAVSSYLASQDEERLLHSHADAAWSLCGLGHVALRRGDEEVAARRWLAALDVHGPAAMKAERLASCLAGLAELRRRAGDLGGAAALLATAQPLAEASRARMLSVDVELLDAILGAVRSAGVTAPEPTAGPADVAGLAHRLFGTASKSSRASGGSLVEHDPR